METAGFFRMDLYTNGKLNALKSGKLGLLPGKARHTGEYCQTVDGSEIR